MLLLRKIDSPEIRKDEWCSDQIEKKTLATDFLVRNVIMLS